MSLDQLDRSVCRWVLSRLVGRTVNHLVGGSVCQYFGRMNRLVGFSMSRPVVRSVGLLVGQTTDCQSIGAFSQRQLLVFNSNLRPMHVRPGTDNDRDGLKNNGGRIIKL